MELQSVTSSYKRWAPVYDRTFGSITKAGRRRAVDYINKRQGSVLEIGVGTGLSLGLYASHLSVSGIDYSEEMLAKAKHKVDSKALDHVKDLRKMDARYLDFEGNSFDTVVAMYLISVVPDPERVMREMVRVCKPGGEILIVNHFAAEKGAIALAEKALAPFAERLGWHADFDRKRVTSTDDLELKEEDKLPPFGLFTFMRFVKKAT